jgi:hypothetical protein
MSSSRATVSLINAFPCFSNPFVTQASAIHSLRNAAHSSANATLSFRNAAKCLIRPFEPGASVTLGLARVFECW